MALNPETDERLSTLMRLACAGDKEAYDALLRESAVIIRGFVERRVGRNSDTEDVLQEILISIHEARHTFNATKPFAPWVFAIAKRRVCDHWRKEYRRLSRLSVDALENDAPFAEPEPVDRDVADKLAQKLEQLPEKQRLAVDLLKLQGYSIKEAALKLKMTEAALKVTAHRAYEALRRKFEVETDGNV